VVASSQIFPRRKGTIKIENGKLKMENEDSNLIIHYQFSIIH